MDGIREGSTKAVLADLGLRAVVVQEEIEATEEELDAEIVRLAERMGQKPERVRRDLDKQGVLEAVRSDIARGKALEFLIDHAASSIRPATRSISLFPTGMRTPIRPLQPTQPTKPPNQLDSVPEEPQA